MFSNQTDAVIDTAKLNQSPIEEAVNEAARAPKTRVSQLILRSVTNGFSSRSESGQANVGFVGSVQRGLISSNSRTSAIRQAWPDFVNLDNVWEVRGRNIGERMWQLFEELAPEVPLQLRFDASIIVAFVGVSQGKITEMDNSKRIFKKALVAARDERIALLGKAEAGGELTDEEQELVAMPWKGVIPAEDTVQAKSILDLKEVVRFFKEGEGRLNRNKKLIELSGNALIKEVADILTKQGRPALASAAFGAMQADLPSASVFGGVSLNLAFTTGEAQIKNSFFTAVGDSQIGRKDAGADHVSNKELSSGVFCEPALIDVKQMGINLSYLEPPQFKTAMTGIYSGLALVTPNGGQRCNVTRSAPEFIVHVVSSMQPLSFESAFLKPIEGGSEEGDMVESAQRIVDHLVDFKSFAGVIGRDFEIVILGTPTVMAALENVPDDWTVVNTLDELIDVTNQLTGV